MTQAIHKECEDFVANSRPREKYKGTGINGRRPNLTSSCDDPRILAA